MQIRQTIPVASHEPEFDVSIDGHPSSRWISFLSNDYFGLSRHPEVISRAQNELQQNGLSICSSRVVGGTSTVHQELELRLGSFYGLEAALLFSSGYMANLGAITELASRDDVLILDRLCHASIYDATVLSGAKMFRFQHNNVQHLEEIINEVHAKTPQRKIVVATESVFSMDGDKAPLMEIAEICKRYDTFLLVDDAHSITRDTAHCAKLLGNRFVQTITLSKTFGGIGGAIGCSAEFRAQLVNCCRPFIYDTALPPLQAAGVLAALDLLERVEIDPDNLLKKAAEFRGYLQSAGFDTGLSSTQIVPLMVGDENIAIEFRDRLKSQNILVGAIRTPSVPPGKARLRFSINHGHSPDSLKKVADIVVAEGQRLGLL